MLLRVGDRHAHRHPIGVLGADLGQQGNFRLVGGGVLPQGDLLKESLLVQQQLHRSEQARIHHLGGEIPSRHKMRLAHILIAVDGIVRATERAPLVMLRKHRAGIVEHHLYGVLPLHHHVGHVVVKTTVAVIGLSQRDPIQRHRRQGIHAVKPQHHPTSDLVGGVGKSAGIGGVDDLVTQGQGMHPHVRFGDHSPSQQIAVVITRYGDLPLPVGAGHPPPTV